MVAWSIKDFGGEIPRKSSRTLPDFAAEAAWNCDLSSGVLEGLPLPELLYDLSAVVAPVNRAYRFPSPTGVGADAWLPLPSQYSSVCRSPLANDTNHRLYWTNPNDGAYWSTYSNILAGVAPFNLGTIQPSTTVALGVAASGGTLDGSVPLVGRSYAFTYVNAYGEESAPCLPSATISGASNGTWAITGLPSVAPANPAGMNFPTITGVNLYRTIVGATTGAQFYQVEQFVYGTNAPPGTYDDTLADTAAVNNLTMISESFANPLPGLDGLTALAGGMLVGFTGNTIHFCEPDRPHAWPAGYDQSVQYEIQTMGVWQQALMVMTQGFPYSGSGNSPSNFLFTTVRVPEPCLSRGSLITDLMGVYYASQNGLVMLNYFGMQNQTLSSMTKNIWLDRFKAVEIIACRHRSQYLAMRNDGSGTGFLIDYADARIGFVELSTLAGVTCVWNDEYSGDTYIIAAKKVYRWDSQNTGPMIYRWRSKQFYGTEPVSLGACQIALDPSVTNVPPSTATPLSNNDPTLVLPAGINAVFRLYAGPHAENLVLTYNLTETRSIFRVPGGFKAFDWQCEIVSQVGVRSIELASTMRELRGV